MFEYDENLLGDLKFGMLYPPEGDSSILEVSEESIGPFLHVMLARDGQLVFSFFSKSEVNLTEKQFSQIRERAQKNVSLTDMSLFDI
jgi:hypothetical protein